MGLDHGTRVLHQIPEACDPIVGGNLTAIHQPRGLAVLVECPVDSSADRKDYCPYGWHLPAFGEHPGAVVRGNPDVWHPLDLTCSSCSPGPVFGNVLLT